LPGSFRNASASSTDGARKIDHPERCPSFRDEPSVLAQLHAQRTQRLIDDPRVVGAEEDHVAGRGAGALQDAADGVVRQEFEYW
jgi:hypothetical protein